MEFITSAILGGILYDATKKGVVSLNQNMKSLIKGYILTDHEIQVLTNISKEISSKDSYSEIDFIQAIESNEESKNIMNKLKQENVTIQVNNIQTNNGAVMGDNHGSMNFGKQ